MGDGTNRVSRELGEAMLMSELASGSSLARVGAKSWWVCRAVCAVCPEGQLMWGPHATSIACVVVGPGVPQLHPEH